jgi:hypothetical protein
MQRVSPWGEEIKIRVFCPRERRASAPAEDLKRRIFPGKDPQGFPSKGRRPDKAQRRG